VVPHDAGAAVVAGPKPNIEYPTATVPPERAYTDPEGRHGAASFVAGIENPDGTTKGLSTPEIRAVAKSIARLVEGGIPAPGQNGSYSEHNNTLRVYGGMSPRQSTLAYWATRPGTLSRRWPTSLGIIDRGNPSGDRRASPAAKHWIVKDLQAVSRLERPHLWADDAKLNALWAISPAVIHEYRNRLDELFADTIRHYMVDPAGTKKVAPTQLASSETWSTPRRSARSLPSPVSADWHCRALSLRHCRASTTKTKKRLGRSPSQYRGIGTQDPHRGKSKHGAVPTAQTLPGGHPFNPSRPCLPLTTRRMPWEPL
jgi:hypothetical protein